MTNTKNRNKTAAFLIFEIITGSALIYFPKTSGGTGLILAAVCGGIIAVPFSVLVWRSCNARALCGGSFSPYYGAVCLSVCLYSVYFCAKDYVGFCDDVMLPFTPKAVICAVLFISAIFVGYLKRSAFIKLAMVQGCVCLLFFAVLFSGLLSSAQIYLDFKGFDLKNTAAQTVKIFAQNFGALGLLPVIIKGKTVDKKGVLLGTGLGAAVIILAVSLTNFTLGEVALNLSTPFYTACGTVKIGEDFARVDLLCLFNIFTTAFIKLSALFLAAKEIIFALFKNKPRVWYAVFCAAAFICTVQSKSLLFLDSFYAAAVFGVIEFSLLCFRG